MKKTLISFLTMAVLATGSISLFNMPSVHAATTDESTIETSDDGAIKVSLDNIRSIMLENNLDIKILYNKVKIAREVYDSGKSDLDTKNSDKTAAEEALANAKATNIQSAIDAAQADLNTAEADLTNAQKTLDSARDDLKTARDNCNKEIESQVYTAQQAYISYLSDLDNDKIQEDTAKQSNKKEQIYKLQYDNGFISKNKYTQLLQGNTSDNDLNSFKNTKELDFIKLCNLLGISTNDKMTFDTDLSKDFEVISKINYDDDLSKMLANNLDIQLQNDTIDDLDDEDDDSDTHDYKVDNANMQLTQLMNTAETNFKQQYNNLMTSYNSIKSSYDVINQEQQEYQVTQTKYNYGFISKNDLDAAKLTLDKDNADFIKKRNECYLQYLKYIEMKEGY